MVVILDLRSVKPISFVLSESMVILPSGWVIRSMAATSELLPAPVRPTMPIWSIIMIVISPHCIVTRVWHICYTPLMLYFPVVSAYLVLVLNLCCQVIKYSGWVSTVSEGDVIK